MKTVNEDLTQFLKATQDNVNNIVEATKHLDERRAGPNICAYIALAWMQAVELNEAYPQTVKLKELLSDAFELFFGVPIDDVLQKKEREETWN